MANESANEYVKRVEEKAARVLEAEAATVDAEGRWPERSIAAVTEAGLLSLTLPAEAGGLGAGMREFAAVTEQLARSCASTAMIYLMHICGAQVIVASQSPNREAALEQIISDGALATLAISERGSRSHFWAPVSRALRHDGAITLNCEKSFVTSAGQADYYVTSSGALDAQTPLDSTLYLVEKSAPGLQVSGRWNGIGLRGNASAPMRLSECRVQESQQLTPDGAGFKAMMEIVLPFFQIGSAAVSLGIAEAAFASAVKHTSTARLEHLGESLAGAIPGIRARLARMRLTIDSARGFLNQALSKIESGSEDAMLAVLGVKAVAAEAAIEVTDEAMRACGGAAFSRQLTVERNFRDARAASIMAPTTDVLYDFIGKAVAGIPLF
jgi:alkylation response protein AidB-like acyl-CoA dehydrogenase